MKDLSTTKILDVKFYTEKKEQILKKIITRLKNRGEKFYIVTPNPELVMHALSDNEYKKVLNRAQFSLPDGIGVLMASKILKKGISKRITGSDFMLELVKECAKEGLTVGFFGGRPGVAEDTAECLKRKHPELKIAFVSDRWNKEGFEKAGKYQANNSQTTSYKLPVTTSIDMLFVALGSPKQEKWISNNLSDLPVTGVMGVGGAFDFISGRVKRAPKFVRNLGLEWLFRLIIEPWRIKRQINLIRFVYLVFREKFGIR